MDVSKWFGQAKGYGASALSQASGVLGAGVGFAKAAVGQAWLFGSTETSASYSEDKVDEKHYFLIPDRRSEPRYSLYSMRCLPEGVPPINDLPKRRLFHLPNEHAMPTVEHILLSDARKTALGADAGETSFSSRLKNIADEIDRLDGKVFSGALLIGGLVAFINPVAGAVVAMKAILPSVGLMLSRYGLQYAGDAVSARELAGRIKAAEKDVLQQFRDSGTGSIVNPLLAQLDRALETEEHQYDPIFDFDPDQMSFGERDRRRMFKLTCQAITNTYQDAIDDRRAWSKAQLGPEDLRYLKMIRQLVDETAG